MSLIMVADPDFKGKSGQPVPQVPRAWAMRKLFDQGMSVGDIARKYEVKYIIAYKSINPPRQAASSPTSTAAKPLTLKRLKELTRTQLEEIAYAKQRTKTKDPVTGEFVVKDNPKYNADRVQAAADELERRGLLE